MVQLLFQARIMSSSVKESPRFSRTISRAQKQKPVNLEKVDHQRPHRKLAPDLIFKSYYPLIKIKIKITD